MNACHSGIANRQTLAIAHLQGEGHFFVYAGEGFYPLEFIIHIVPLIAKTVSKMLADYSGPVGIVGEFSEAWAVFRHQFSQITGGGIHRAGNNCHFVLVAVGSWQIKRLCRTISIAKIICMVGAGTRSGRSRSDVIHYTYIQTDRLVLLFAGVVDDPT